MAKHPRRAQRPQPKDRLPKWWRNASRRLDLLGHLAERIAPSFEERPWLPFLLLLFPVLLLILAWVVNGLR